MKNKYGRLTFLLFCVVCIVATFFRVYNLPSAPPGLYPDEAVNGNNAAEALATGEHKLFYPENNGREGMFVNIQSFALGLFGVHEPWVLRSVSALFGILTVLGLFLLILRLYRVTKGYGRLEPKNALLGIVAAFFGSFLMAVSFWHVNFSRIGFRAIMAPFFIVWSMWVLLGEFEKKSGAGQTSLRSLGSYALVLVSGILFGLGMHTYIAYRALPLFVLFIFALFWVLFHERTTCKRICTQLGVFVLGSLISTATLISYFLHTPQDFFGRTSQISIFNSQNPILDLLLNIVKTILSFFWFGDYNWRHNYAGMGELHPTVSILFLAGVIAGVVYVIRHVKKGIDADDAYRGRVFIFLFASALFVVALLPTVVSDEGIPHALRAIIMIPAAFILVGMGAEWLFGFMERRIRGKRFTLARWTACIALFLIFPALHVYYLYFDDWAHRSEVRDAFSQDYVEVGRQINALPVSVPKYVVVTESSVDVRGIPVRAQTTMFITDTFQEEKQKEKNVHYVLSKDADTIPAGSKVFYIR